MDFKDILKELRASKDITQEDLAKATGLKRSAIGMYESGKRRPDFETLEIFADYFNLIYIITALIIASDKLTNLGFSKGFFVRY